MESDRRGRDWTVGLGDAGEVAGEVVQQVAEVAVEAGSAVDLVGLAGEAAGLALEVVCEVLSCAVP